MSGMKWVELKNLRCIHGFLCRNFLKVTITDTIAKK